jgi:pyridoxamine 5'-phosphate oxidase
MKEYISKLRKDYSLATLEENEIEINPILQFEKWFKEAANANISEPNAMNLSTVSKDNKPSSRIVLLRNVDKRGFVFYTNYNSRKAKNIDENPFVSLTFFWVDIERQVRIEGRASKLSIIESDEYFKERPRLNQIGAWASPQSEVIENREVLEQKLKEIEERFKDKSIERPPFWGGYLIEPQRVEFWQGRPGRLHDRIEYTLSENKDWKINRLAP